MPPPEKKNIPVDHSQPMPPPKMVITKSVPQKPAGLGARVGDERSTGAGGDMRLIILGGDVGLTSVISAVGCAGHVPQLRW